MADGFFAKVQGIQDLRADLLAIPAKLRVRALRNALAAGARLVQRAARQRAPLLKLTTRAGQRAYRKGYRKPGTVRQAISVRTSKVARRAGDVGVFVNVRPAKGVLGRGAKNAKDPFYWRWLEFGWNPAGHLTLGAGRAGKRYRRALNAAAGPKMKPGQRFLRDAVSYLSGALAIFQAQIGPAIAKLNRPKAPAP